MVQPHKKTLLQDWWGWSNTHNPSSFYDVTSPSWHPRRHKLSSSAVFLLDSRFLHISLGRFTTPPICYLLINGDVMTSAYTSEIPIQSEKIWLATFFANPAKLRLSFFLRTLSTVVSVRHLPANAENSVVELRDDPLQNSVASCHHLDSFSLTASFSSLRSTPHWFDGICFVVFAIPIVAHQQVW